MNLELDFTGGTEDQITGHDVAAGDVLLVGEEMMVVTSYDVPSNLAVVVRGFDKTTKASHAKDVAVKASSVATYMTTLKAGSKQFAEDTGFSVVDITGLVAGRDVALLSDSTDLEYEKIVSFNAGTNFNATRGLYGTEAIEHPELTTMVIQFSGACGVNM
jgi:hypothetical protein